MERAVNTVEILEHVCTFLSTRQVLSLQMVNKKWRSLVYASPQLSLHLFVEPRWSHPATEFQLLLLAIPGLEIRRDDPVHLGQWVEVRMSLNAAKQVLATAKRIPDASNEFFLPRFQDQETFSCRLSAVRFVPPKPSI